MAKLTLKTLLFGLVKHAKTDLERKFEKAGIVLTPFQYGILSTLKAGSITLHELAMKLGVKPPSLIPPIDTLVKKGYATRTTDRTDRRRVHLSATKKGQALFKKIFQDHPSDSLNIAFHKLTKAQRAHLLTLLEELNSKLH